MYRIIDKKCSGKTSRLLLLAKENNGVVVCSNPEHMREKAYSYGITGIDFISYVDFACELHLGNKFNRHIFIDELDKFFNYIEENIIGYTISED